MSLNGKGDKQRPTDLKKYGDNYDRIFKKHKGKLYKLVQSKEKK